MSARCDLTDLLVEMCAHCLGHQDTEVVSAAGLAVTWTMQAGLQGRCALDGRHAIEVGDQIGKTEHGWVCGPCIWAAL